MKTRNLGSEGHTVAGGTDLWPVVLRVSRKSGEDVRFVAGTFGGVPRHCAFRRDAGKNRRDACATLGG